MPKAIIRLGSHGEDVKRVQRYFVRAKILYLTHLDGDFGPETDGLVRSFQQENGLVVDGIVGPRRGPTRALPRCFAHAVGRRRRARRGTAPAGLVTDRRRRRSGSVDGWLGSGPRRRSRPSSRAARVVDEQTSVRRRRGS